MPKSRELTLLAAPIVAWTADFFAVRSIATIDVEPTAFNSQHADANRRIEGSGFGSLQGTPGGQQSAT
jgi:hypothetical protein